MKCPKCGTPLSDVLDTRDFHGGVFSRRRRRCFNGHTYFTVEVSPGCLDKRAVMTAVRGSARASAAWTRREAVRTDDGRTKTRTLALRLGITEARVRQLRLEFAR